MIARLRGFVDEKGADWVVIDVNGVGYRLSCSARALAALPAPGGAADLRVETAMRDDAIVLYGFISAAERQAFDLLRSVQGVGPRHALSVLSVLAPSDLATAVASGDKAAVSRADGVGPKLAQRLVNELKDKAAKIGAAPVAQTATSSAAPASASAVADGDVDPMAADAVSALVNLGYGRSEAFSAVATAKRDLGDAASFDALVKAGLKALSG